MSKTLLLAVIASVGTFAVAGAAGAVEQVTVGGYTLADTTFGAQTGVHGDGTQGPANTVSGHVNQENSDVTFSSSDLISWTGQGEAIIQGEPSLSDLLVTFEHGWGAITFNFLDPTTSSSDFTLNVNGGAAVFTQGGNCTFCIVDNGENKFTLTGNNITSLAFTFDPDIGEAKQFRVRFPCVGDNCEEIPGGFIPEPATWAMMILGFGGVGALLRRRRGMLLAA